MANILMEALRALRTNEPMREDWSEKDEYNELINAGNKIKKKIEAYDYEIKEDDPNKIIFEMQVADDLEADKIEAEAEKASKNIKLFGEYGYSIAEYDNHRGICYITFSRN